MKALITGAGGFLGRHVVTALLRRGHSVRVLVRPSTRIDGLDWADRVEVVRADLRAPGPLATAFEGVDVLAHLAARVAGTESAQMADTVVGTERLLEAMAGSTTRRLVLASSFSVYGWGAIRGELTEESPLERDLYRRDGYAIAKTWQERVVRRMSLEHQWDLTVLRPGFIWGRDHEYLAGLGQKLGRWHLVFGPWARLPLTHVENCADCFALAMDSPRTAGETFNVVDGHDVSTWRYLGEYLRRGGAREHRAPVPYAVAVSGSLLADWTNRRLFRGRARLPGLLVPCRFQARFKPLRFNTRKLEDVLGWKPPFDFAECLRRTYDAKPAAGPPNPARRRNLNVNSTMPEPLTIGYLTSQYARVGDTYVRREVEQLRRLGHVVHTFSIRQAGPNELVSDEIRREHARTVYLLEAGPIKLALAGLRMGLKAPGRLLAAIRLVLRSVPPGIEKRWARRAAYLLEAAYLAELLVAKDVRHLHNHIGENSALVAMLSSVLSGIPYSLTIHGPGEFDRPTLLALDEKVRHAAFVAAISEFTRSQLYRWADYADWPKIHVVRIGVSPMYLEHGPSPIPAARRLVNIGRIVEQKGQAILIQAAAVLRDRGLDFELVIVGDGPMRGEIERLIDRFDLTGRVRVAGYLNDQGVMRELLAARALVLPSFAEGLPGVFFEAMALGRPVISTSIAAHSELIEPGTNGWLVPAGAVEPLADAMAAALTASPDQLERMGRAGSARIIQRHDAARETRALAELFAARAPGGQPAGTGSARRRDGGGETVVSQAAPALTAAAE